MAESTYGLFNFDTCIYGSTAGVSRTIMSPLLIPLKDGRLAVISKIRRRVKFCFDLLQKILPGVVTDTASWKNQCLIPIRRNYTFCSVPLTVSLQRNPKLQ